MFYYSCTFDNYSLLCHLQRLFLLDLHSYHDCHVCITKLITLAKRRFFAATRTLWCSILASVLLISFQLILCRISGTPWPIPPLAENTNGVKHRCSTLETLVGISGSVWVENSYVRKMLFDLPPKILLLLRQILLHPMCWLLFVQTVHLSAFAMLDQSEHRDTLPWVG